MPVPNSWLDFVLATPALGLTLNAVFRFPHDVQSSFSPVVDGWSNQGRQVQADVLQNGQCRFDANGITYFISNNDFVVEASSNNPKWVELPGKRPILGYDDIVPVPFHKALELIIEDARKNISYGLPNQPRKIFKCGVVATCRIDSTSSPPGLVAFLEHVSKPWGQTIGLFNGSFLATVGEGRGFKDRCHHQIDVNEIERPKDIRLRLDWQRVFSDPVETPRQVLLVDAYTWARDAIAYFERFASGDLNYDS